MKVGISLIFGLFLLCCVPVTSKAQQMKIVRVELRNYKKSLVFGKNADLYIVNGRDSSRPIMLLNGFIVPELDSTDIVTVYLKYKHRWYQISRIYAGKFSGIWKFTPKQKGSEKHIKWEYSISFDTGQGCGTAVTYMKFKNWYVMKMRREAKLGK